MSEQNSPRTPDQAPQAGEESITTPVTGPDSAPRTVEREDVVSSGPAPGSLPTKEDVQPAVIIDPSVDPAVVVTNRQGMWGDGAGSPDTSGYGGLRRSVELPGTATPPFGGWYDLVAQRIAGQLPGFAERVMIDRDELTFVVPREVLTRLVRILRDDPVLRFEICVSVSGVHYPQQAGRELHAVYHLLSITHNRRLRLEVAVADADPHIPSVVDTYPMANYHERETWDMFGIIFDGHPALTRILMPDDWIGHPQRKDYPLGGIPVEYKGATVPPPDERRSYLQ